MHSTRSPFFRPAAAAFLVIGLAAIGPASLRAAEYAFSDHGGFLTYSGTPVGKATFDGIALDPDGSAYLGNGYTDGGVSFSILDAGIESLFAFSPAYYGTPAFSSTYLNNNGGYNDQGYLDLKVTFSKAVHSFGLDLAPLINATGDLRTWFTFSTGSVEKTYSGALLDDPKSKASFFGYYSDAAFSSFTIRDYSGALALDNLEYSDKIRRSEGVPDDASTLGLAAAALAMLTGWAKRKEMPEARRTDWGDRGAGTGDCKK